MSFGLSSDFKELVRSRTNLVELIGENVALKALRGGTDFLGLCPFHNDHNPSFHVYPQRGTYRCWVCQEGGDCFSFVMKHESVEFRDALELLAKRAGIEMPRASRGELPFGHRSANQSVSRTAVDGTAANGTAGDGTTRDATHQGSANAGRPGVPHPSVPVIAKPELYDVLAWAERLFHEFLVKSPAAAPARDYLLGRGFTQETIVRFKLGYHPDDWDFVSRAAQGKFSRLHLIASTLLNEFSDQPGKTYSPFKGRVIFPIHDERGRTVAFGGRVIPGRERPNDAKYKNSSDSPVFHKSRLVFGLHAARDTIRKSEPTTAVVVEGYADCIMCHQHGLTNVVGTLGTALAESHVELLKRFARRVVLVFDADKAGRDAAERALGKFLAHDVDLRVLTLPAGSKDPDEYLQTHSPDAFRELVKSATDVLDYKLARAVARHGVETEGGREAVLQEMLDTVSEGTGLAGTPREDRILQWLSQRLLAKEETVRRMLRKLRSDRERRVPARGMQGFGGAAKTFAQTSAQTAAPLEPRRLEPRRRIEFLLNNPSRHDLLESELLEILLTEPRWTDDVRRQISVEDLQNEHLRDLAQYCFDIAEDGEIPTLDRLMSTLEDEGLKQLAVMLDERARTKNLQVLLENKPQSAGIKPPHAASFASSIQSTSPQSASPRLFDPDLSSQPSSSEEACLQSPFLVQPPFLVQTVNQIIWRRHEQSHQKPKHEVAQLTHAPSGLDDEARALLMSVYKHNARRAGNTTRAGAGASARTGAIAGTETKNPGIPTTDADPHAELFDA